MLGRLFANVNKKLGEKLVSKAEPAIKKIAVNGKLMDDTAIAKQFRA